MKPKTNNMQSERDDFMAVVVGKEEEEKRFLPNVHEQLTHCLVFTGWTVVLATGSRCSPSTKEHTPRKTGKVSPEVAERY